MNATSNTTADFVAIARSAGFNLKEGYNDCPLCRRNHKFRLIGGYYNCFHPECIAHHSGDIYKFLTITQVVNNLSEAYRYVKGSSEIELDLIGGQSKFATSKKFIENLFDFFIRYRCAESDQYLIDRGIDPLKVEYGYCPSDIDLTANFNKASLISLGIISKSGYNSFRNRIIFPIYNSKGYLVHFQGRTLDKDSDLRWMSTKGSTPINHFVYNNDKLSSTVILTEGITDCISLNTRKIPAVASSGLEPNLKYAFKDTKIKTLTIAFDRDRYPIGSIYAGEFKSWPSILRRVLDLIEEDPNIEIGCFIVPDPYKDINEWIIGEQLESEYILEYLNEYTLDVPLFIYKYLPNYPGLLLSYLRFFPQYRKLLDNLIKKEGGCTKFIMKLIEDGHISCH